MRRESSPFRGGNAISPQAFPTVAEAIYKTLKTEFVKNRIFSSQWQLERELTDYINWYNCKRSHSSLGYVAPFEYKGKVVA